LLRGWAFASPKKRGFSTEPASRAGDCLFLLSLAGGSEKIVSAGRRNQPYSCRWKIPQFSQLSALRRRRTKCCAPMAMAEKIAAGIAASPSGTATPDAVMGLARAPKVDHV